MMQKAIIYIGKCLYVYLLLFVFVLGVSMFGVFRDKFYFGEVIEGVLVLSFFVLIPYALIHVAILYFLNVEGFFASPKKIVVLSGIVLLSVFLQFLIPFFAFIILAPILSALFYWLLEKSQIFV